MQDFISNIETPIKTDWGWDEDTPHEVCPVCGDNQCHILNVRRDTRLTEAKYGDVVISYFGECGHYWAKIFSDHKGRVYVNTAVLHCTLKPADKKD